MNVEQMILNIILISRYILLIIAIVFLIIVGSILIIIILTLSHLIEILYGVYKIILLKLNLKSITFINTIVLFYVGQYIYKIKNPIDEEYIVAFCNMNSYNRSILFSKINNPTEELYIKLLKCAKIKNIDVAFINKNCEKNDISIQLKWELLKNNCKFITKIENPTEEMCVYALRKNPRLIKYIKNKTETIYLKFIGALDKIPNKKRKRYNENYLYFVDEWTLEMIKKVRNLDNIIINTIPEDYKKYIWTKHTHHFLCNKNKKIVETLVICNKQMKSYKIPLCVLSIIITCTLAGRPTYK